MINVVHHQVAHTTESRTFPTRHHFQNQLHNHNGPNQLYLLGIIYIRHFRFDFARSCIMTRLAAVATAPHSRRPLPVATLILTYILHHLLLNLLLGQNITCILSSQYTSLMDTCFFSPLLLTKGLIGLPKSAVFLHNKCVLVGHCLYTLCHLLNSQKN